MREVKEQRGGISLGVIDRALMPLAPGLVRQRTENRLRVMAMTGGLITREATLSHRWKRKSRANADEVVNHDLAEARGISLEHMMTSGLGRSVFATHIGHTVGSGLRLDAQPDADYLGISDDERQRLSGEMEMLFAEFARHCDWHGQLDFDAMQQVAFCAVLTGGDCFVMAVDDDESPAGSLFTTRLQVIEAHRVSNPYRTPDSPTMSQGVERDENGRIVAYHVCSGYPDGYGLTDRSALTWQRVPVRGEDGKRYIYHLLDPLCLRPGQSRGVPILTNVLNELQQLTDMTHAELAASVLAACLGVERVSDEAPDAEKLTGNVTEPKRGGYSATDVDFTPGMVVDLAPGERIGSIASNRPNTAFAEFEQAITARIAAGTDMSQGVLMRRFQSSYSAARGELLEVWRLIRRRREWFSGFPQWAYEIMADEAVDRRYLRLPGYDQPLRRRAWLAANWIGPSEPQMDEEKAVRAAAGRVELGISTRKTETAKLTGVDYGQVQRQLAREQKERTAAGLVGTSATDPNAKQQDSQPVRPNQVNEE